MEKISHFKCNPLQKDLTESKYLKRPHQTNTELNEISCMQRQFCHVKCIASMAGKERLTHISVMLYQQVKRYSPSPSLFTTSPTTTPAKQWLSKFCPILKPLLQGDHVGPYELHVFNHLDTFKPLTRFYRKYLCDSK